MWSAERATWGKADLPANPTRKSRLFRRLPHDGGCHSSSLRPSGSMIQAKRPYSNPRAPAPLHALRRAREDAVEIVDHQVQHEGQRRGREVIGVRRENPEDRRAPSPRACGAFAMHEVEAAISSGSIPRTRAYHASWLRHSRSAGTPRRSRSPSPYPYLRHLETGVSIARQGVSRVNSPTCAMKSSPRFLETVVLVEARRRGARRTVSPASASAAARATAVAMSPQTSCGTYRPAKGRRPPPRGR
jgi:hypothetical protein